MQTKWFWKNAIKNEIDIKLLLNLVRKQEGKLETAGQKPITVSNVLAEIAICFCYFSDLSSPHFLTSSGLEYVLICRDV